MKKESKQSKMKEPLFVAFTTQKGGVGKSAFTTLMASWLHYTKRMDVAVVDCDHPQYSLNKARKREVERVNTDPYYTELAHKLFSQISCMQLQGAMVIFAANIKRIIKLI